MAGNTLLTVRDASLATHRHDPGQRRHQRATSTSPTSPWRRPARPVGGATAGNNTLNGTAGNDTINALAGNDTVNGGAGNDTIIGGLNGTGGPGADILNGDAGDDTFIWNANTRGAAPTDGRDIVNGGTEGGLGDTFVINGNAQQRDLQHLHAARPGMRSPATTSPASMAATEIVITRNGTNFAIVIAELREIEEIRINSVDPAERRAALGPATPSTSSATSRAPACASTPSRSMAMRATTRSTSRR